MVFRVFCIGNFQDVKISSILQVFAIPVVQVVRVFIDFFSPAVEYGQTAVWVLFKILDDKYIVSFVIIWCEYIGYDNFCI